MVQQMQDQSCRAGLEALVLERKLPYVPEEVLASMALDLMVATLGGIRFRCIELYHALVAGQPCAPNGPDSPCPQVVPR